MNGPRTLVIGLVLTFCLAGSAEAGCKTDGVLLFPAPGGVIPLNARFILEGLGSESSRVARLGPYDQLLLKARDDLVTLKITRTFLSENKRTAVELKPEHPLRPNRVYTLSLDRALAGYKVLNDGSPAPSWKTGAKEDATAPKYVVKPAVSEGLYQKKGERLERFLKVRAVIEENGIAYWVATLQRARGSTAKQTYPVFFEGNEALIGHDECSGGFIFEDGRAYKLELQLLDSGGNAAEPVQLEVQAPRP